MGRCEEPEAVSGANRRSRGVVKIAGQHRELCSRVWWSINMDLFRIKVSGGLGTQIGVRKCRYYAYELMQSGAGDFGYELRPCSIGVFGEGEPSSAGANFMEKQLNLQRTAAQSTAGYLLLRPRLHLSFSFSRCLKAQAVSSCS